MKIPSWVIPEIAEETLKILSVNNIRSLRDILACNGTSLKCLDYGEDRLVVNCDSGEYELEQVVLYNPSTGIKVSPMRIVIDQNHGFSRIIVKADSILSGYQGFLRDGNRNYLQRRIIESSDAGLVPDVKRELERLARFSKRVTAAVSI
jgi:hypothetical protein